MRAISKGIVAGWLGVLVALPAFAQETKEGEKEDKQDIEAKAEAETDEEAEEEGKDWSVSFRLGNTIGQGTFVDVANDSEFFDPNCTDPIEQGCVGAANNAYDRVNLSFALSGGYTLGDFSFGTSLAAVQWLTAGGGANAPSEFRWQDVGLSAGWAGYTFESIGLNIAPGLDLVLPTSRVSQYTTLVVGTSLGVGISKTFFDKLSLSLGLGGGKDFHRFTSPVLDLEKFDPEDEGELQGDLQPESVVYRAGASEDLGRSLVAVSGMNTEYSFSGSLSASIPVWDKLKASASYALVTFWSYPVPGEPGDELTPDVVGINEGRGVGQVTSTGFSLSYPITLGDVNLGLSGGISTSQFPKTSDNKSFRFPFWNTTGAASNASALKFGVSASY